MGIMGEHTFPKQARYDLKMFLLTVCNMLTPCLIAIVYGGQRQVHGGSVLIHANRCCKGECHCRRQVR